MQRIGVLNGNSITYDHDISALVRWLTDWGVIEWGLISDNKVLAPIQAIVSAQRSNGQKLLLHFESDEQIQLPTSWSYKVYIEVDQSKIDDGQANAENGTGIASIKTGENLPSKNVLQIAKVTNGQIEQRTLIPKLQSISQRTTTLESKLQTQEEKVGKLEEAGTPDHLSIKEIIGEKYKASDLLTRAYLPLSADSDIPLNFGETAANKELHIQRISSGHTDNKIKVKLKKTWNPTSNVTIEVRKGVKVESGDIVYRYGGEVLATATIQANQITTSRKEFTATLDRSPLLARGELYSVVIKCQGSVYHNADFYQIACSGERSEAFCAVQVNNNSRVRTDYMPYCESSIFLDYCLAKRNDTTEETVLEVIKLEGNSSYEHYFTLTEDNQKIAIHSTWREIEWVYFYNGGTQIWSMWYGASGSVELSAKKWDTIRIQIRVRVASGVNITVYRRLKKPCSKILHPKEIKNVGEVVECTIYWLHNNVFVWDQIDTTPTSSATTGRLTLGNAVAFFSIIGKDGKTYKIPAYWA